LQAPNVHVVASKSGKCTTNILKDWFVNNFKPHIKVESLLLLDAFGGFNKATEKDDENRSSDDDEGTNT